jgi:hypothetical protein
VANTSLVHYVNIYNRKKFYSAGPDDKYSSLLCLGASAEEKYSFATRNFRLTKREKPRSGGRKRRSSKKRFPCRPQTCQVSGNNNIFVQLVFSSNVTSDTVILTKFVKNLNFCGRLYSDSLVAKPLSDLYCNNSSNFQSNDW